MNFFQQNLDLIGHLKIKQFAQGEKYLFISHLKKNEMAQGRESSPA